MKDPLELLMRDQNIDAYMRGALEGRQVSPAIGEFATQDRLKLMDAMEGALIMLTDATEPASIAAATILKRALQK